MRLELIVFFITLALFLYWKFGGKFVLPKMGGVGTRLGGAISGAFTQASGDNKHRVEFIFLFFLVLVGLWVTVPAAYSWLWEHGKLTLFMSLITIGYIVRPPKSKLLLKMGVLALLSMGIYSSIPEEKMEWAWDTFATAPEASATTITQNDEPARTVRTIEVTANPGVFTEVTIPPATDFRWDIQEGCLIGVAHDGDPNGSVYDCAEYIELGTHLHNLRIGFSSKTDTPIKVTIKLTPL